MESHLGNGKYFIHNTILCNNGHNLILIRKIDYIDVGD